MACGYQTRAFVLSSEALANGWEVVPHPSAVKRDAEGMAVNECLAAHAMAPQPRRRALPLKSLMLLTPVHRCALTSRAQAHARRSQPCVSRQAPALDLTVLNAARQPLLDALEEEAEAAGCDSSSKVIMLCENGGAPKVWLARSEGGQPVELLSSQPADDLHLTLVANRRQVGKRRIGTCWITQEPAPLPCKWF